MSTSPASSACTAAPKFSNSLMRGLCFVAVQHLVHRHVEVGRARSASRSAASASAANSCGVLKRLSSARTSMNCCETMYGSEKSTCLLALVGDGDAVHAHVELPLLHRRDHRVPRRSPASPPVQFSRRQISLTASYSQPTALPGLPGRRS